MTACLAHRCIPQHEATWKFYKEDYDWLNASSTDCLTEYHCPQPSMSWFEKPRTYLPVLYVILYGGLGLGNQMFQMASVYGIAKKSHMNVIAVIEDNCFCPHKRTRPHLYYQQFGEPLFLGIPYVSRGCLTYKQVRLSHLLFTNIHPF